MKDAKDTAVAFSIVLWLVNLADPQLGDFRRAQTEKKKTDKSKRQF